MSGPTRRSPRWSGSPEWETTDRGTAWTRPHSPAYSVPRTRKVTRRAGLRRALLRAGLAEFRSLLEYKAAWYGKRVVVIDRHHPSSRLCSDCGWKNSELRLSDRTWSCRECGTLHDRDLNAAKNILAAGLVVLESERESARLGQACRADIRPQDQVPLGPLDNASCPAAAPAVKQETLTLEPAPA